MPCSATTISSRSIERSRTSGFPAYAVESSGWKADRLAANHREARMIGRDRHSRTAPACGRIRRRTFLADVGLGFTGMALGAMLHRDGIARADGLVAAPPDGRPHLAPRARSVIRIFLSG